MRAFSTLLAAGLSCLALAAHGSALKGRVTNTDGEPLPAVSVVTNLRGIGAISDAEGHFELQLSPEITRVTFSSVGYYSRQCVPGEIPEPVVLERRYYRATDILVTADRAEAGVTPVAFDNLSRREIARDYTVGEFPILLESTPNLFAYTDGGALGYSYTSIRGFDDKRITTYINGVPLNDPEDQATYFVDLPDFASNVDDIQVQRGVGNSLYGDASFGGTINVVTNTLSRPQSARFTSGFGSYTRSHERDGFFHKQSVEYSSGLIDGRWHFAGRFSRQQSDGYRRNAWYEGWSYYFALGRVDPSMTTELYIYGGPMTMHLAYNGSTRAAINADRLDNPLTYGNETDNFNQPHYHLHNTMRLSERTMLYNTLYYIRGDGYYEQYKADKRLSDYNIDSSLVDADSLGQQYSRGDIVRQQWVGKNQIGWNPRLEIEHGRGQHALGGSVYYFNSDHSGEVVWAQHINGRLDPKHKYYQYFGAKWQGSAFVQEIYRFTDQVSTQLTAQMRYQRYKFDQTRMGAFPGYHYDVDWLFFSPRVGCTYKPNELVSLFANFAMSSRTPTDASIYDAGDPGVRPSLEILSVNHDSTDYVFGKPTAKNEHVYDFEIGGSFRADRVSAGVNLFWMDFRDEILPYGGLTDNGIAYTTNAERSVHAGIELSAAAQPTAYLSMGANFAFNYNRVKEYTGGIDVYNRVEEYAGGIDVYDSVWVYAGRQAVDYKDKTIPGFPDYLGSFTTEVNVESVRVTNRIRVVGRRYMELMNVDSLSLSPFVTASLSAEYRLSDFLSVGNVTVQGRIDNLFDKKYESSGYGYSYGYRPAADGPVDVITEAEYYVAPERTYYLQIAVDML